MHRLYVSGLFLLFLLFSICSPLSGQVENPLRGAGPDTLKPKIRMDTARFWRDSMERRRYLRDGEYEKDRAARLRTKRRKFKIRYSDRIQYAAYLTWPYTTAAGIPSSLLLQKTAANLDQQLFTPSWWTDSTNRQTRRSIPKRLLRMLLLDMTVESVLLGVQQDMLGHAIRAKEEDVPFFSNYSIRPPIPFWLAAGKLDLSDPLLQQKYSRQQLAQVAAAGLESSNLVTDELAIRWMMRGSVDYREALHYLRHQTANLVGVALANDKGPGTNPFSNYLYFATKEFGYISSYNYTANNLRRDYMLSTFTNPLLYNSIINVFHNYLRYGEDSVQLRAIPLGHAKSVMPGVRLNLTPFGTEWMPELAFRYHRQVAQVYARLGNNAFSETYGGGIRLYNIVRNTRASVNLHGAFWNQQYLYKSWSGQTVQPIGWGWMAGLSTFIKLSKNQHPVSLALNASYKSKGYVEGEPWQAGPVIKVGLSFALERDYEEDDTVPEYEFVTSRKSKKSGVR
ncbi:MAG: hypothetical protein IT240_07480, partial [Bacteroidia bacterium]|nr:hypothetical protein [Bacteroidia bacterium]